MDQNLLNAFDPASAHRHTRRCWYDPRQARWVCPNTEPSPEPATDPAAADGPLDATLDCSLDRAVADIDHPGVDTRDMVVVHTAMLRELRLAPAAVLAVADGDRRRAAVVDRHVRLVCDLLHHHHHGEDELLWPVLRDRLPASDLALLDVAEAQHAGIGQALTEVASARPAWAADPTRARGEALAAVLTTLHVLLEEHTAAEERYLLPLAAAYLTETEWAAVSAAGAASVPKKALPLVFGMFAYEGDPEVLAGMLASAPLVPRVVVPRIAPRLYARHARSVHGTARP